MNTIKAYVAQILNTHFEEFANKASVELINQLTTVNNSLKEYAGDIEVDDEAIAFFVSALDKDSIDKVMSQFNWVDGKLVSCTTLAYDLEQTQRYIDLEGPKEPIFLTTCITDAIIEHVSI